MQLTIEEFEKLVSNFGEAQTNEKIENLGEYIASKGVRYKCHYATIMNWHRRNGSAKGTQNKDVILAWQEFKKNLSGQKDEKLKKIAAKMDTFNMRKMRPDQLEQQYKSFEVLYNSITG